MKVPPWMIMPLNALGLRVEEVERKYAECHYETVHTVQILEELFEQNLLAVDLQEGPVEEGETILVRGMPLKVLRIQEHRLTLTLPPGKKFRRKWDWREAQPTGEGARD